MRELRILRQSGTSHGTAHDEAKSPEESGFLPVPWSYLCRLDEVPCDIFIQTPRRPVLYATTGMEPATLKEKAAAGVPLLVRSGDTYLLRRMLTVSLDRTLADSSITPAARSKEAYQIASSIMSHTFARKKVVDRDEISIVQETIDVLSRVLSNEDESLWTMVASMQKVATAHNRAINAAVYGIALAKSFGISDYSQLRDIGRGALLMDIGLTIVPKRILDKEDMLSPQERRALERHPLNGQSIVTRALGGMPSYAHIIAEHHERADGSGYPTGRKSNQIALDSQIVAIVDVFEQLTSEQHGEPGLSPFEACQQMRFAHPGEFNDDLMRCFVQMLGGWSAVRAGTTPTGPIAAAAPAPPARILKSPSVSAETGAAEASEGAALVTGPAPSDSGTPAADAGSAEPTA